MHEWEWALHFLTGAHMPIPRVSDLNENSSLEPTLSATSIQSSGQTPRESLLATCTVGLYTVRTRARGFRGSDAAPCSPRASRPNTELASDSAQAEGDATRNSINRPKLTSHP